jgi:hypothetical protein
MREQGEKIREGKRGRPRHFGTTIALLHLDTPISAHIHPNYCCATVVLVTGQERVSQVAK